MSKLNFCTLFDSNYLSRGLVLYDSLRECCPDFHLYVFAFNDRAYEVLSEMNPEHMTVIPLSDFEDEALLAVKGERSRAEYCWTSTSSTILYVLEQYKVENCTYLDADMRFYSNPRVLIDEMEASGKSVLITSHRYTRRYDQSLLRGKYCVQFMYFKNNSEGREVLHWWRNRCLEWCYNRVEDGKFGDQKYLDDWTTRFPAVHELQHEGGGLAPWNCQQYYFSKEGEEERVWATNRRTGEKFQVVFFHFHGLSLYPGFKALYAPRSYTLSSRVKDWFYRPYVAELKQILHKYIPNLAEENFHAMGTLSGYYKGMFLVGYYSWLKRNVWRRIFPPATGS